jgi:glycosyltransferase involved in cell wall biosynthesis
VKTGEEKFECFAQADIFCFPTFFEAESFGLVALEAMQFELPVVATNWRGVPSVVEDNKSGFLVPPRDPGALAAKLEAFLVDPALRMKMGQKGRRNFLEKFTTKRFNEDLQQALISV